MVLTAASKSYLRLYGASWDLQPTIAVAGNLDSVRGRVWWMSSWSATTATDKKLVTLLFMTNTSSGWDAAPSDARMSWVRPKKTIVILAMLSSNFSTHCSKRAIDEAWRERNRRWAARPWAFFLCELVRLYSFLSTSEAWAQTPALASRSLSAVSLKPRREGCLRANFVSTLAKPSLRLYN